VADASAAIARAIDDCNAAGGGRVVVPAGKFLTGPITLRSNVNLHVSKDATLLFKTDKAAFPIVRVRWEGTECMNFQPLIYAWEQENIAVTGGGTLDGCASHDNWWVRKKPRAEGGAGAPEGPGSNAILGEMAAKNTPVEERIFGAGHTLRPPFFQPIHCKNVLIEDVTILRSPFWEITPVYCENVTVRRVNINSHGPNNDGCDPDSCRDVLIEDCVFDTGDDCIAIKSGRNEDGRRVNRIAENHVIRRCVMKDGHGGVVIGSEIAAGCRNVFVEDCRMDSPDLDRALRFKSNAARGGVIENIHMRNVTIGQVAEAVITVDFLYQEGPDGPHKPVVRNVSLENVTSSKSPRVLYVAGFPGATIDDIRLKNCTFKGIEAAEIVSGAGRISFENVDIIPASLPRSLNSPRRTPGVKK
jgi:unsaturated rhamnogalacturonyl hydrolase